MATLDAHPDDARQAMQHLIELTGGRASLEILRTALTDRLHRRSDDFDATHALRLVTAKLQGTSYGTPAVSTSS